MVRNQSQEELEAPAKVYQLEALTAKVGALDAKLDTIINQTKDSVSKADLELKVTQLEADVDEKIKSAEERVDLKYAPLKAGFWWFASVIIIAFIGNIIASWFVK